MKPRIYVETSIVSYLTARPSRSLLNAARQQSSAALLERSDLFDFFVSDVVVAECSRGDASAATKRLEIISGFESLALNAKALDIAKSLLRLGALPEKAKDDCAHLAVAAAHEVDMIASWNFRHIAGAWARRRIETAFAAMGFVCPIIATPEEIIEEHQNGSR
jgi:PIN domain